MLGVFEQKKYASAVVRYFNSKRNGGRLWKPHGSATITNAKWIFPPDVILNRHFESYARMEIKGKTAIIILSLGFSGNVSFNKDYIADLFGYCSMHDIRPDILKTRELVKPILRTTLSFVEEVTSELFPEVLSFSRNKGI